MITKDSRVIACAALYPNPDDAIGEIACVATHPDYRDSGHGERLIEKLVEAAQELHLNRSTCVLHRLDIGSANWAFNPSSKPHCQLLSRQSRLEIEIQIR